LRRVPLAAVAAAVAVSGALIVGGVSSAQSTTLPTVDIALTGTSITVSGSLQSGAVNVTSTTTSKDAEPTLFRLNPGVTADQVLAVLPALRDPNKLAAYGSIVFDADAPKGTTTVQTVLPAGDYIAIDTQGPDPSKAPHTTFTVAPSEQPATLPAATSTVHAIDFGFRAPRTLRNGTVVRFQNDGFLVHMIFAIKAKNASDARRLITLLKAGEDSKAEKLSTGFESFLGPASSGAVQQMTLKAKAGTYVLACFMETQDHREHTRLGMLRTVRITG
jgi:hypothetical protein